MHRSTSSGLRLPSPQRGEGFLFRRNCGGGFCLGGLGAFGFFGQSDGLRLVAVVAVLRENLLLGSEHGVVERPLRGDAAVPADVVMLVIGIKRCWQTLDQRRKLGFQ